jgi:hypothetical protein
MLDEQISAWCTGQGHQIAASDQGESELLYVNQVTTHVDWTQTSFALYKMRFLIHRFNHFLNYVIKR